MLELLIQVNLLAGIQLSASSGLIYLQERYTQTKARMETVEELAYKDFLTGSPNRMTLSRELESAVAEAQRCNQKMAVFFVDIDRFKLINDTFGHEVRDELLVQCARRFRGAVRTSDMVARISGDEFVVLKDFAPKSDVHVIAERIISSLRQPFIIHNQHISVTGSVGASLFPEDGDNVTMLLRNSDSAMYKAKKRGKNSVQFFEPTTDDNLERQRDLENGLKTALNTRQLSVFYQPIFDLRNGRLVKLEALLRWAHPKYGTISPAEFIPIAEESGLINLIGEWVLERACRRAKYLQEAGHGGVKIAVNVSSVQFSHPDFLPSVHSALSLSGLRPQYLELELTESIVMHRSAEVKQVLTNLTNLGIVLAVDDFGTGYSSLAYLRDLPISTIKIDKSFVQSLDREGKNEAYSKALVDTILGLAKALDLSVVAEGVENETQGHVLRQLGCHFGQGYLFAKPLPSGELDMFLSNTPAIVIVGSNQANR